MDVFTDRVHRLPRKWSNREISKYAHLFRGDVVNVSGWKDVDKEGRSYRDYFVNASSYTITNYKAEARGFQGGEGEIFLDLEESLPNELNQKFDTVFNHTTLEHVYAVSTAFSNLCDLSKDIVIVIVPFLQQYHADYGDYWRFTPLAIKRLFEDCGLEVLYQSFNSHKRSSVYLFSIASRRPENWRSEFDWTYSSVDPLGKGPEPYIGCHALPNLGFRLRRILGQVLTMSGKLFKRRP
jgi:hypothetical protein